MAAPRRTKAKADKPAETEPKTEGARATYVVVNETHTWKAEPDPGFEHRSTRARHTRES